MAIVEKVATKGASVKVRGAGTAATDPRRNGSPRVDPLDQALVEQCQAGDPRAQRELFLRGRGRVYATLRRLLGPRDDLEDLVQEIFFAVFRGLHMFRGESSLWTWIRSCAVRMAYAHIRRERARPALEPWFEHSVAVVPLAERRVLAQEAARRLQRILNRLPPEGQQAFALHDIAGHSMLEVADLMHASIVATKARAWRARQDVEHRAIADPILAEYFPLGRRNDAQ